MPSLLPANGWLTKLAGKSVPCMVVLLVRNVTVRRHGHDSYRLTYASAVSQKGNDHFQHLGANETIILK